MDLEQRYTEENNYFQFDDYFFEALKDFSSEEIKSIIKQCTSVVDQLPLDNSFPQYVAGVTTGKTPKFFIVEYFKEQGVFNKKIALKFKNNILSKGGTEDPMDLYIKFRGRKPTIDALLKRSQIV